MFAVFRGCFVQLGAVNGDNGVSGRAFIFSDHGGKGEKSHWIHREKIITEIHNLDNKNKNPIFIYIC